MISSATKRDDCMGTIAACHPDFLIPCCYSFHSIATPRPHIGFDPARRAGCLDFTLLDIHEAVGELSGMCDDRAGGGSWRRPATPRHALPKEGTLHLARIAPNCFHPSHPLFRWRANRSGRVEAATTTKPQQVRYQTKKFFGYGCGDARSHLNVRCLREPTSNAGVGVKARSPEPLVTAFVMQSYPPPSGKAAFGFTG